MISPCGHDRCVHKGHHSCLPTLRPDGSGMTLTDMGNHELAKWRGWVVASKMLWVNDVLPRCALGHTLCQKLVCIDVVKLVCRVFFIFTRSPSLHRIQHTLHRGQPRSPIDQCCKGIVQAPRPCVAATSSRFGCVDMFSWSTAE